jgi:hypothetical protein
MIIMSCLSKLKNSIRLILILMCEFRGSQAMFSLNGRLITDRVAEQKAKTPQLTGGQTFDTVICFINMWRGLILDHSLKQKKKQTNQIKLEA